METHNLIMMVRFGTPPDLALRKAKEYIKLGADVNVPVNFHGIIDDGSSIIYIPIQEGHLHMVKLLFENGSIIQSCNNKGVTPLDFALYKWYHCYQRKITVVLNSQRINPFTKADLPISNNISKYRKLWPSDEEIRAYKIVMFLIENNANSNHTKMNINSKFNRGNDPLRIQTFNQIYDAFLERQKMQKKVDVLFALILNTKTYSNIGTQIVQLCSVEEESYLTFNDICF